MVGHHRSWSMTAPEMATTYNLTSTFGRPSDMWAPPPKTVTPPRLASVGRSIPVATTTRKGGRFAHKININLTFFSDQHTCHEGLQLLWS